MLVIKRIIILSILIFLSSCLLFRNDYKKEENINTLKKLITEDGTYLSDDNANEITPFILVYPDYSNSESRASGGYIVITTNYFESNRLYIITNYYLHNYNTIITNVLSLDNTNFIEIYYPANSSEVKEVIYFTNVCFIHTNYVYSEGPHIAITNSFVSNGITNYVITKYYYNIDDYYYRIQNMTITNSKSILLFSSDREGDYNIYFAEKNTNNIFKRIIKFDDLISTKGNNEYSPVIFVLDRVSLISFIREDSQGRKKIVNYLLTNGPYPDQNTYSEYHAGDIKHIGIVRGIDKPELIVSYGKNFLSNLSWDFSNKNWKPKSRIYTYSNVYSAEAYEDLIYDGTNMYKKRVYALELIKDSNSQLALGIETNYGLFSIITLISNYSSIYNDKFPSIEPLKDAGSFLYFSSDRYGKGNYDIFRYNNNTFDKIVNPYGVKGIVDNSIRLLKTNYNHTNVGTNLVFNYSYPTPHLRWEEINATNINLSWLYIYGAIGYKLFYSTNINGPYNLLIYTNYTNYKHYNLEPNYKYYYKISAVYSYGESFNNPVYAFTTLFSYPVYISYSSDNGFSTKIWWSFVKGATAYKIYYSPNQYGPYSLIHTEYSNGTNVFEHKDLLPAKSNYYRISALNNTYESPMSPYYQVMTKTMLVGTIAGNGYSGFADGDGISAKFYYPEDVVFDINGNAYIADKLNHRIRKITPDSNVSTFSGSGSQGSDDGPATYACFNCPMGLTIDNSGIIYVADSGSHKIRKVNPDGSVQTIAGSGLAGGVNGNGVSASFNFPSDLVIASNGTIYVADTYNHVIRAIDTSYNVTTFAGTMGSEGYINDYGTSAKFNLPKGICIDKNNEYLYVSDTSNHVIRKINIATKQVTTIAGKGIPGYMDDIGTNAQFNSPEKIAIDTENRLYVVDRLNHKIRVIYPDGAVKTLAGFGGTALHRDGPLDVGPSDSAAFNYPSGIGIYNLNIYPIGKIFITDTMDHRIRIIYYVP